MTERSEIVGQEGAVGLDGLAAAGQRFAIQALGLGPSAERLVDGGEVAAAHERVGMVGAQLGLAELERRLEQRDRLGQPAGRHVGGGQVVAVSERVGVVGAQLRLVQLERRLVQRDRLRRPAGVVVGDGQVARLPSVSGWSGPSFDSQSLSVFSYSSIASDVRPAVAVGDGQVVAAVERVGVVGAQLGLPDFERPLVERDRLGRPTDGPVGGGQGCGTRACRGGRGPA